LKKPAVGPSRRFAATPHFVSLRGQRGLVTNDSNPTLWDPEQKSQLVWAGDAATFPSTDVREVAAGLAYTLIPTLKKQKLI